MGHQSLHKLDYEYGKPKMTDLAFAAVQQLNPLYVAAAHMRPLPDDVHAVWIASYYGRDAGIDSEPVRTVVHHGFVVVRRIQEVDAVRI